MEITKDKKIIYSTIIAVIVLLLSIGIPTLSKFRKRGVSSSNVWTGSVASSYRSGTGSLDDPYIISNGDELAFFSSQLENNNYEGKHFKITNNIRLNEGMFKYENNKIVYTIGSNTYYVNGTLYYDNDEFTGNSIGSINVLSSLDGFRGELDGDSHTIYGYFNTESLFTDLKGDISSLYIENAFINTNKNGGILADTITSADLENIVVDGYLISSPYIPGPDPIDYLSYLSNYSDINDIVLGGIGAYAYDSTLINCVSKVNIQGGLISGGLVGYSEDSSFVNAYSTGVVDSYSSNTIGVFLGTGTVDKVYNSGVINGGLLGYLIDANINISNSFVATDNYLVVDETNSEITSTNNYYITSGKGDNINSTQATLSNLKDKTYLVNYNEFVSADNLINNPLNVWVFEEDSLPVLIIDDVINNYVELNANTYMWNTYNQNLNIFRFTNNITFVISNTDNIHNTDKYYYITNSRTPISKSALENVEWTPYNDVVVINEEGFYVIYVKTVDNNDNVSYINSDILILDNSESDVTISTGNYEWTDITSGEMIMDHSFNLSITAVDNLSGIKSVQYYLSNSVIIDMDTIAWVNYTGPVNINSFGEYILYTKVVDQCEFVSYASTPKLIYEGYVESNIKPINFNEGNSITKKSSIMFDVNYTNNRTLNISHDLVSSTNLPVNTKITMIDKTNDKVYSYVVDESTNRIHFTSFKEVGKMTNVYYTEGSVTNESFTFIIDFSNCTIENDLHNVSIYVEGKENDDVVRPIVTKQPFNVLTNNNLSLTHTITTTFNGTITYNSDSNTIVTINNNVVQNNAYDTDYSNKKTGLAIKVVDANGNVIDKNNLKNIIFAIGNNKYAPESDNIIRINLNTSTSNSVDLSITTYDGNLLLEEGTYYIKIYGYASHNGIYFDNNDLTDPITIPLTVLARSENNNYNYRFNVLVDAESRIVDKGSVVDYTFLVLQDGIANPNIKVSLYKKDQLTAYNQDYTLIDMQTYTSDQLDRYIDMVYYVTRNALSYSRGNRYNVFNYSLNTTNLDKTGYKFVFDLYDGSIKVESINKYIIIR